MSEQTNIVESELLVRQDGPVLRVHLNRPQKRNALSRSLVAGLRRSFEEAASNAGARVALRRCG